MAKADLRSAYDRYEAQMSRARAEESHGDHAKAILSALAAWPDAEDMMKYARKYEGASFSSVSCADMVLKWAPLVFDIESLDTMATLAQEHRAIERTTGSDIPARIEVAKAVLRAAHRLWTHIECSSDCRQDELRQHLGGDQEQWRSMSEAWEHMRLIRRTKAGASYVLTITTNVDMFVRAKCMRCGHLAEGARMDFLVRHPCGGCMNMASFVVIEAANADIRKTQSC